MVQVGQQVGKVAAVMAKSFRVSVVHWKSGKDAPDEQAHPQPLQICIIIAYPLDVQRRLSSSSDF